MRVCRSNVHSIIELFYREQQTKCYLYPFQNDYSLLKPSNQANMILQKANNMLIQKKIQILPFFQ